MVDIVARQFLRGAAGDAVHDFHISKVVSTKTSVPTVGDVLKTLPVVEEGFGPGGVPSEAELLAGILGLDPVDPVASLITQTSISPGGSITKRINGLSDYDCEMKILMKDGNYNLRDKCRSLSTSEYRAFFGLEGSDTLNVVIDAQTVGMNKLFGLAVLTPGETKLSVNNVFNREVVNDPAPKTYELAKLVSTASAEYNIKLDQFNGSITYPSYEIETDLLFRNKFFSTLDICLSPLKPNNQGNIMPKIQLDLIDRNKKMIHQSSNPHSTNAISTCLSFIRKFLGLAGDKHIKCSAFFQCKRSGDWLQALSCLDTGRKYSDGLSGKIVLVTHDRILLWYALFMKIDVIFTCSAPPDGVAAAAAAEEVEDDDLDPGAGKRKKIMMYFRASRETTAERLARIRISAGQYRDRLETYDDYIVSYNEWIREIISGINHEIQVTLTKFTQEIQARTATYLRLIQQGKQKEADKERKAMKFPVETLNKIQEIIKLHWKYTAIHYVEITMPVYPPADDNVDLLDSFISSCITFENLKRAIPSKNELLYKSKSYLVNDEYTHIVNLLVDYNKASRAAETNEIKTLKLCNYLQFRLPDRLIQSLIAILEQMFGLIHTYYNNPNSLVIRYVIDILKRDNLENMTNLIAGCLKWSAAEVLSDAQKAMVLPEVAAAAAAEVDGEPDIPEDVVDERLKRRERAFVVADINYDDYLEKYAINVEAREGRFHGGGGSWSNSYMMYLGYLYKLMGAIKGFDTSDSTDYMYYDALSRLVLSSIKPANNKYDELLAVAFSILTENDWDEDGNLIESKSFKNGVSVVAHNVALQSINRRSGDIPYSRRTDVNLLESSGYKERFKHMTAHAHTLTFNNRQVYILRKLSDAIHQLKEPEKPMPIAGFSKIKLQAGIPLYDIQYNVTRKNSGVKAGGFKKRYKKSPRRKTLRKTRRHK